MIVRDVDVLAEAARRARRVGHVLGADARRGGLAATEPGTAPPRQRLRALARARRARASSACVGMAPILPGHLRPAGAARATSCGPRARPARCGIWANVLYLSPGTREHFLEALARDWPELLARVRAALRRRAYLPKADADAGARRGARARRASTASATAGASGSRRRPSRSSSRSRLSCAKADRAAYNRRPMPDEITCLIVDDHEVVREGLRLSLSRAPHIRVVGEASDGESAVELAQRRRPDVVIMDVRMPGMDGLEATKQLTESSPRPRC